MSEARKGQRVRILDLGRLEKIAERRDIEGMTSLVNEFISVARDEKWKTCAVICIE